MSDHPPCACAAEGWCQRYRRHVLGNAFAVCRAENSTPLGAARRTLLARWTAERDRAEAAARPRPQPCVHLGPATGELRDCETCRGNVRQKVFGCAIYGETTLRNCEGCRDFIAPADDPGGMGEAPHADDHYALTFAKGAGMALYRGEGDTDRSLEGWLKGETVFFLGGGPSLAAVDLARLEGRKTLAVNNVVEVFPRPTIWLCADYPGKFPGVPWESPETLKLVPRAWASCELDDGTPIATIPSVKFYLRNGCFNPWRFLEERTVNWGSENGENPDGTPDPERQWGVRRSVMLAALKLLWYFGVARVVLLGVDFHMDPGRPYAHSEPKGRKGCDLNNDGFRILGERFTMLRPVLEAAGMTVVNATEGSRLEAFERVELAAELAR